MKVYSHNPNIFRDHYRNQVGNALPGFRGTRMQYGNGIGSILGAIARRAIPLLKTGAKIIAPHLKKAARNIATDIGGRMAEEASTRLGGNVYKRKSRRNPVIRRKKVKASTSKRDYFN